MRVTVYADMLFLVNWLMDYVLLQAVRIVLGLSVRRRRMAAAAGVGALWVCLITVIRLPEILEKLISLVFISGGMVWIAFRPKERKLFLKELIILFGIAILGSGIINLVYFHSGAGIYLRQLLYGKEDTRTNGSIVLILCAVAVWGVSIWVRGALLHRRQESRIYTAVLVLGDISVTLKGLLDTGNQLREPMSKRAVHIAERGAMEPFKPDAEDRFRFLVPFHAVGTDAGWLTALRVDRMELTSSDGDHIILERPLIGLYEGKLSTKNEYQLILHSEIETKQGEIL